MCARMPSLVMIDGRVVAPDAAHVSVFDRGFLYGDSVFETVRTYGGRPFELFRHIERLERSARRVHIDLPVPPSRITEEVERLVGEAGNPESYIRVMVTRGSGELGLEPADRVAPLRVVIVTPLKAPPARAYREGIEVVTFRTRRTVDATAAAGAKVANYLVSVLAMREAKSVGASEALVVDGEGCVVEGATSNVFALIGDRLVTPPEDAGILPGITRARMMEAARQLDLALELRALPLEELRGARELFVCSSIRELLPVVRIDSTPVGEGVPGPTTLRLLRQFRENVKKDMGLQELPGGDPLM
jgi:branched-chain amino acid aminotransferase